MRWPVPSLNWWNWTSFCSVAGYSFTGTVTRPKLTAPLQIARAIVRLLVDPGLPSFFPPSRSPDAPHDSPRRLRGKLGAVRAGRPSPREPVMQDVPITSSSLDRFDEILEPEAFRDFARAMREAVG